MRNCSPGIDLCKKFAKTYELAIPEPQLGDVLLMGGVLLGGYLFLKDNDSMEQYILQIVKIKKYK